MKIKKCDVWELDIPQELAYDKPIHNYVGKRKVKFYCQWIHKTTKLRRGKTKVEAFLRVTLYSEKTAVKLWGFYNL